MVKADRTGEGARPGSRRCCQEGQRLLDEPRVSGAVAYGERLRVREGLE